MWSAGIGESSFIKIFELISAIIVFGIVYTFVKRVRQNK